jgi:hypothetical protein
MLAFLCRWGLTSPSFVLAHQRELRRHHPFNATRFAAYTAFFQGADLRRRFLNRVARAAVARAVPADVCEFAHQYDRWIRFGASFSVSTLGSPSEQN